MTAPALAQALENWAVEIEGVAPPGSATYKLVSGDDAAVLRAAAAALRAAVRGAETPTCATHGDPLVCLACEADEDNHPAWRAACLKCGGLPPGEASGAGDLCYCTPAAVPLTQALIMSAAEVEFGRAHRKTDPLFLHDLAVSHEALRAAAEAAPLPPQGEPMNILRPQFNVKNDTSNCEVVLQENSDGNFTVWVKPMASPPTREALTDATLKAANHAYNIASAEYVIKTPEGQYVQAECDAECAAAMRAVLSALPPPATPGEEQP